MTAALLVLDQGSSIGMTQAICLWAAVVPAWQVLDMLRQVWDMLWQDLHMLRQVLDMSWQKKCWNLLWLASLAKVLH